MFTIWGRHFVLSVETGSITEVSSSDAVNTQSSMRKLKDEERLKGKRKLQAVQEYEREVPLIRSLDARCFYALNKLAAVVNEYSISRQLSGLETALEDSDASLYPNTEDRVHGGISPGCSACRVDSGCTIRITNRCNRNCFFCFVKLDEDSQPLSFSEINNNINRCLSDKTVNAFAISGGEPLIFPDAVIHAFAQAKARIGAGCHCRLYTNGDYLSKELMVKLAAAGADELRLSLKPNDQLNKHIIQNACNIFSAVWFEIPALPGTASRIQQIIDELDTYDVKGLNVLELYYTGQNSQSYRQHSYKLRRVPIRSAHWSMPPLEYPIYGSRTEALKAVKYAKQKKTRLSVHACLHETRREMFIAKNRRISLTGKRDWHKIDMNGLPRTLAVFDPSREIANIMSSMRISGLIDYKNTGYCLCHPDDYYMIKGDTFDVYELLFAPDYNFISDIWVVDIENRIPNSVDIERIFEAEIIRVISELPISCFED